MELVRHKRRSLSEPATSSTVERDLELTRRADAGDAMAARELVERLLDGVRATVYCLAGNDRDADDFVQLSVLEILGSARTYRAESSLDAWAAKVAVRTTMRQLSRRRWRAQFVVLDVGADDQIADHLSARNAEELLAQRRLQTSLLQAMSALRPKYQVALILRLAQGYSVAEIAEITDTTFNTVRERLRVGRQKLHRLIEKHPQLSEWIETKGAKRDVDE